MRSAVRSLALVSLLAVGAVPAFGQVTVGTYTDANCFPLNCGSVTRYQEIYTASAFGSSPFLINTIGFFMDLMDGPTSFSGATASLSIGTTSIAPSDISWVGDNPISNSATFFSNVLLNGPITDPTFGGTPYLYDPTQGNLILDWTLSDGPIDYTHGFMQVDGFGGDCTGAIGRAWISTVEGDGHSCGSALVTQFNGGVANVGVTPEPATLLLLGTGLFGVAAVGLLRRTATA